VLTKAVTSPPHLEGGERDGKEERREGETKQKKRRLDLAPQSCDQKVAGGGSENGKEREDANSFCSRFGRERGRRV
jgi:hypothetical protein